MKNGGLLLYPTDTIWGIGCNPYNENSIQNIFILKNRISEKNFILLVSSLDMLKEYVPNITDSTIDLLNSFDVPTTLIFTKVKNLPNYLLAADGSIAIRIIKHPYITPLIELLKTPLISTSANISGHEAPKNFSEIDAKIIDGVDAIMPQEMDTSNFSLPSRILKIEDNGSLIWIRN